MKHPFPLDVYKRQEMARAADAACIQYRMLNRGKGPAVHSLRAQADRIKYREYMKHTLERQENLFLMQDEIVSVEVEKMCIRDSSPSAPSWRVR